MPGSQRDFLTVTKEQLFGGALLTSLLFHPGGNVYVLSYQKDGQKKYTLIDSGDERYYDEMLSILAENDINVDNIERIILTHRHSDHTGLADLLAGESGGKIIAHHTYRSVVEGQEHNIEYIGAAVTNDTVELTGIDFPILSVVVDIGENGRLDILGTPKTRTTHSPDQLVVLYSPRNDPHPHVQTLGGFRPADDIIFSGDLWLMRGPMFSNYGTDFMWNVRDGFRQIGNMMSGGGFMRRDPREQDAEAKDALKKGFCLIRVKPGHGDEFLGSRIIPRCILADNDILVEFGYPLGTGKGILNSAELAQKVSARREQAYNDFIKELTLWLELGYSPDEITGLLVRIYREQSNGGPLVEEDRWERRQRLNDLLTRLKEDKAQPANIRQLAESTQSFLRSTRI